MEASARGPAFWRRLTARDDLPILALGAALILAAAVLIGLGWKLTFYQDVWEILMERRPWSADSLLMPFNEHLVVFQVITTKLACEYQLPADPNANLPSHVKFDKDKVNVSFTSNMGVKEQVYRVDSLDKCTSTNAKAWYYDNNTTPTKILLCPSSCSAIQVPDGGLSAMQAGSAPMVDVTLGCKSLYAPPA